MSSVQAKKKYPRTCHYTLFYIVTYLCFKLTICTHTSFISIYYTKQFLCSYMLQPPLQPSPGNHNITKTLSSALYISMVNICTLQRRELCSSGLLHSEQWYILTEVSGRTLRMELTGCPEMSVRNYHYSVCNNPEEHSPHLLHDGSLKLRVHALAF